MEKNVIKSIEEVDPLLAQKIRNQMFLFEDIVHLDDRTVRLIINEMDKSDMVLGLKGVSEDLVNKFLNNMSARGQGYDARRHGRPGTGTHQGSGKGAATDYSRKSSSLKMPVQFRPVRHRS